MASRGVHCLDPGLKVAAWAEGPLVQNSSGWPCQCVLRSWPDHLDWPHSGWYIIAVVLGCLFVPRWRRRVWLLGCGAAHCCSLESGGVSAGCLWCSRAAAGWYWCAHVACPIYAARSDGSRASRRWRCGARADRDSH